MKVIFAIGNPGSQYAKTRHNAGLIFANWLIKSKVKPSSINQSTKYTQVSLPNNKVLCMAETYMNESGKAVDAFMKKNRGLSPADFIIVHDDLEHKLGNARIKEGGSAQGQKGIESIAAALRSKSFKRLQLGIDRPQSREPQVVAKYVLSKFSQSQLELLNNSFQKGFELLQKHEFI